MAHSPLKDAFRDMLCDIVEWRSNQHSLNVKRYAEELAANRVTAISGDQFTTSKCRCDVCLTNQKPGTRKLSLSGSDLKVCDSCWGEIAVAAGVIGTQS
jgi:hypothetical protein